MPPGVPDGYKMGYDLKRLLTTFCRYSNTKRLKKFTHNFVTNIEKMSDKRNIPLVSVDKRASGY